MNKFSHAFTALATIIFMVMVLPTRNAMAQTEPNTITRGQWDSQTQAIAMAAACIRGNTEACEYNRHDRPTYSSDSTPFATQRAYDAREEQFLDINACAGTPERRSSAECQTMAANAPALLPTARPAPVAAPAPTHEVRRPEQAQRAEGPAPPVAPPTQVVMVPPQAPMGMGGMMMGAGNNQGNWCGNDRVLFTGPITPRHAFLDAPPPFDQSSSGGRMIVFEIHTQMWNGGASPFSFAISMVDPTQPVTGMPLHIGTFHGYGAPNATPATLVRYARSGIQCLMPVIPNDGRVHRLYVMIPPHQVDLEVQAFSSPYGGISTNVSNRVYRINPFTTAILRGDPIIVRPDSFTANNIGRTF